MEREESIPSQTEGDDGQPKHQSTPAQAYFNFIKLIAGVGRTVFSYIEYNILIGIIALPYASYEVGWLLAVIYIIPVQYCVLTYYEEYDIIQYRSTKYIVEIADDLQGDHLLYNDIARITAGGAWPIIVDWAIILYQLAEVIGYLIFLTQFAQVQFAVIGIPLPKWICLASTLIIILPLTYVEKIAFFSKTSKFGFVLQIISLSSLFLFSMYTITFEQSFNIGTPIKFEGTFLYYGVAIQTFEGIMGVLPIRDSLVNKKDFVKVYRGVIYTFLVMAVTMQQSSLIAYGQDVKEIVLFNFRNPYIQFIICFLYAINIILTYPLQLFVAIQIIDGILYSTPYSQLNSTAIQQITQNHNNPSPFTTSLKSITIRTVVTAFIYFIAYLVPDFSLFLNLVGSLFGATLQYFMPTIFHLKHFRHQRDKPIYSYIFILSFSLLTIIAGTYFSLQAIIMHHYSD